MISDEKCFLSRENSDFTRQGTADGQYQPILTHLSLEATNPGVSASSFSGCQAQLKAFFADMPHERQFFRVRHEL